jgi:MFS family permease
MLFVTRMFTGIGEAGYTPAGNSLAADLFQKDQRAKVMSWLSLASLLGPILGLVLGGVIAGLSPGAWRYAFLGTGISGVILAVFAWRLREPLRRQADSLTPDEMMAGRGAWQPGAILVPFWTLLRIKTLVCLVVMGVLSAFTAIALPTYFPILLQQHDTFGLTSGQAALFAGLALGPTGFVGVLLGGYLADWLNRRYQDARVLVCAVSALLTGPLFISALCIMNTGNIILCIFVLVPTFLIFMMHLGPLLAAVLDVVPSEMRASGLAIFTLLQRLLGTAFAPLLVGTLARSFDPGGLHFAHNLAGHDLILALILTCTPAFLGAGVAGMTALRWVGKDRAAAEKEGR